MNNSLLSRRRLMQMGALSASHFIISACSTTTGNQISMSTDTSLALPLGIQLYTLREQLGSDAPATLKALAGFGYQEVELAGLPKGVSATDFRMMLDDNGLKCPAIHAQGDTSSQADIAHTVGASLVVMPAAMELLNADWSPKPDLSAASYQRVSASLNTIGEKYNNKELSFGYHNHAWEMAYVGDQRGYDIMLAETDPDLVFMELDLGWTHQGEVDALDLFARHPGRFLSCHIKDFNAAGEIVNPGDAQVPLAAQLARNDQAGFRHFFVEHDNSPSPLDTALEAAAFVRSL